MADLSVTCHSHFSVVIMKIINFLCMEFLSQAYVLYRYSHIIWQFCCPSHTPQDVDSCI